MITAALQGNRLQVGTNALREPERTHFQVRDKEACCQANRQQCRGTVFSQEHNRTARTTANPLSSVDPDNAVRWRAIENGPLGKR